MLFTSFDELWNRPRFLRQAVLGIFCMLAVTLDVQEDSRSCCRKRLRSSGSATNSLSQQSTWRVYCFQLFWIYSRCDGEFQHCLTVTAVRTSGWDQLTLTVWQSLRLLMRLRSLVVDRVRSEILWNISEKLFFEQFRVNLCAAGQDSCMDELMFSSVCPTWPDWFVRGVKSLLNGWPSTSRPGRSMFFLAGGNPSFRRW